MQLSGEVVLIGGQIQSCDRSRVLGQETSGPPPHSCSDLRGTSGDQSLVPADDDVKTKSEKIQDKCFASNDSSLLASQHHITQKSNFSFSERMASQTQGIQQLLGAEKRAAEKV